MEKKEKNKQNIDFASVETYKELICIRAVFCGMFVIAYMSTLHDILAL